MTCEYRISGTKKIEQYLKNYCSNSSEEISHSDLFEFLNFELWSEAYLYITIS